MNANRMKCFFGIALFVLALTSKSLLAASVPVKNSIGIFKINDPVLHGIKYGNWGSRPYEYHWIANSVTVANKKVIDLGVGLPSQYEWYKYVVGMLKPEYYVGIDADGRMKQEEIRELNHAMVHMDMAALSFSDKSFDVALCISTFEHIPYQTFMRAIQEAHRVLKDDGFLVLTLDERWDKNEPLTHHNGWNTLEQTIPSEKGIRKGSISFGLPDFLTLIEDYFVPLHEDVVIDTDAKTIFSAKDGTVYYQRNNNDSRILHSPIIYNSCVSYAVLKKRH